MKRLPSRSRLKPGDEPRGVEEDGGDGFIWREIRRERPRGFHGRFSTELCGGTHVENTGAITLFKIISESGVAANVRRIEALTGSGVLRYYGQLEQTLQEAAAVVKTNPAELTDRLSHLMGEIKALQSENESLKSRAAKEALGDVMDQVVEIKGVKLLSAKVSGVDMNGLRELGDQLKAKLGEGVVVLISDLDGKVNMIAMATDEAMGRGAHAGKLIKGIASLVGGGGGGRCQYGPGGRQKPCGHRPCGGRVCRSFRRAA